MKITMCIMLALMTRSALCTEPESGSVSMKRGWELQKDTMICMDSIRKGIEDFRNKKGSLPSCLEAIGEKNSELKHCLNDGWGRRLHYYASRSHWVLMSYGEDGKPDTACIEGAWTPEYEYVWDVVMFDGVFSRSPSGIERPKLVPNVK